MTTKPAIVSLVPSQGTTTAESQSNVEMLPAQVTLLSNADVSELLVSLRRFGFRVSREDLSLITNNRVPNAYDVPDQTTPQLFRLGQNVCADNVGQELIGQRYADWRLLIALLFCRDIPLPDRTTIIAADAIVESPHGLLYGTLQQYDGNRVLALITRHRMLTDCRWLTYGYSPRAGQGCFQGM